MVTTYVNTRKGPGLSFVNAELELLLHEDEVNFVAYLVIGRVPSNCSSRSLVLEQRVTQGNAAGELQ